jgi:Uncharacterised nucleotidyltransferase
MINSAAKRALLAALRHEPDLSQLDVLPRLDSKGGAKFLRWLDWSGLALVFQAQLLKHEESLRIAAAWRCALCQRQQRNVERTMDILREAQRLREAFRVQGVTAVALKGFTLAPDFCDDPCIRHQVDFDFLVAPVDVHAAAEALRGCGYFTAQLNGVGETCFRTPLRHIPSADDDLYAQQAQRQVDLHTQLWDPCPWLPVEAPQDSLRSARLRTTYGLEYLGLSLEDAFVFQVLHTFRHSFRSWVRLSWFYEIDKCMANHEDDSALWGHVIERAGSTQLTRSVFAFVLGLVNRLFHSPIPEPLRRWTEEAMTLSLRAWLDHFGVDWAISDWPGSLNNLFLSAEFVPDPELRLQYWRSRLLPRKAQTELGSVPAAGAHRFLAWQTARLRYVMERGVMHAKNLLILPWQGFRWRRALESSRRLTLGATV